MKSAKRLFRYFLKLLKYAALACVVAFIAYVIYLCIWPIPNPNISPEGLREIFTEEGLRCTETYNPDGSLIRDGTELIDILEVENWQRSDKRIFPDLEEPLAKVVYQDMITITVYSNFAIVHEDLVKFGEVERAYYRFPADISEELAAYIASCEVTWSPLK